MGGQASKNISKTISDDWDTPARPVLQACGTPVRPVLPQLTADTEQQQWSPQRRLGSATVVPILRGTAIVPWLLYHQKSKHSSGNLSGHSNNVLAYLLSEGW